MKKKNNNIFTPSIIALTVTSSLAFSTFAADKADEEDTNDKYIERIRILGSADKLRTQGGATTLISDVELEQFEYDDINRVLATVPGVNIREEDGYGLRPNIGFRGATPERSKKISLMEDGVLIAPSPYSAPSAYYFPMVSRMVGVEVFKGPSAIKYGPNTVSGALNLVTRQVPEEFEMGVDLGYGSDGYTKAHAYHGETQGNLGYVLEGLYTKADGFKDIDNSNADTGFDKTDFMGKVKYDLSEGKGDHFIEAKFSRADETSDETYLGLSDEDFKQKSNRRYAATQDDEMDWEHTTYQLTHFIDLGEVDVTTRAYRHEFERAWRKVARMGGSSNAPSLLTILLDPTAGNNEPHYEVLTGQADGEIILGTNDRNYTSQGIQTDIGWQADLFGFEHKFDAGVRLHEDKINRNHFEESYLMLDGQMNNNGGKTFTTVNQEKSETLSVYVQDTLTLESLTITAGLRGEYIDSRYEDKQVEGKWLEKEFRIFLPSVSAFYKLSDDYGVFAGVHKGFMPSSPQQDDVNVDPEESINYELGFRLANDSVNAEIVGFFNDYSNLKEACTQSLCSGTTSLDQEFNGGDVDVYGLEANIKHTIGLTSNIDMPWSLTYTYTESEFKNSFESEFPLWGKVEAGDPVPYMPDHQLAVMVGLASADWQVNLIAKYTGDTPEAAGDDVDLTGYSIDSYTIVDLSANYNVTDKHSIYLKADNIFDQETIVSHRPDGARPGKPQQGMIGYKFRF